MGGLFERRTGRIWRRRWFRTPSRHVTGVQTPEAQAIREIAEQFDLFCLELGNIWADEGAGQYDGGIEAQNITIENNTTTVVGGDGALLWLKATANWVAASGDNSYVMGDVISGRTATSGSPNVKCYLPRCGGDRDPAVFSGRRLLAMIDGAGEYIAVGDFLDDKIGTIKVWSQASGIPTGWALCDGTSNTAGSGLDLRGRYIVGYKSGDANFGTLGALVGSNTHSHTLTGDTGANTALAVSSSGSASASGTTDNATTGLTIPDHDPHTHGMTGTGSITYTPGAGNVDVFVTFLGSNHNSQIEVPTLSHPIINEGAGHAHTFSGLSISGLTFSLTGDPHTHPAGTLAAAAASSFPASCVLHWIERVS